MFDPDRVARQVLRNCDISDARHAGLYSICGLALRLRDLYKWDTGTPPWEEKESAEVLDWIGRKESHWEAVAEDDYRPVEVDGRRYRPFDTRGINAALLPHGFFYGAGYGYSLKPTFFMAAVSERSRRSDTAVVTLGRELARDLTTQPALSQDDAVVLRTEAAGQYVWDKLLYIGKSGRGPLRFALAACGVADDRPASLRRHLPQILARCRDTFVDHEIGEIRDPVFDRDLWRELVAAFPRTGVELLARAVKDLLADTADHGPLRRIIDERRGAAMGFYTAFSDGLQRELFRGLRPAFDALAAGGDWRPIERAAAEGRDRARRYAEEILSLFQAGRRRGDLAGAAAAIEKRLLQPLTGAPTAA